MSTENGKATTCTCRHTLTDRDLTPANRVSANFWKLKYFEAMIELRKANKGIRRLRARCERQAMKANA